MHEFSRAMNHQLTSYLLADWQDEIFSKVEPVRVAFRRRDRSESGVNEDVQRIKTS